VKKKKLHSEHFSNLLFSFIMASLQTKTSTKTPTKTPTITLHGFQSPTSAIRDKDWDRFWSFWYSHTPEANAIASSNGSWGVGPWSETCPTLDTHINDLMLYKKFHTFAGIKEEKSTM
jgi:hypothetical protein